MEPLFHDKDRFQTICAHRRWAKTYYNVCKSIYGTEYHCGALTKPNSLYWVILPTYKQAKLAAWKMLKDKGFETNYLAAKPNETELKLAFKNGSEIYLKGGDNPDSLRGGGLDGASLDEWALHNPTIWPEVIRPALADKKGWANKTFTPKGMNHAYVDFEKSGKKHFYPADTSGVIDPQELAEIKQEVSADEYAQEFLCQFLYYAGQIYKEFRPDTHVVEPIAIPDSWTRIIGIDYGLQNPTAILFGAVDYDGNLWIYDELYESGVEVQVHAANMKLKLGELDYTGFIDPSTAAKDRIKHGIKYSIYNEFLDNGISNLSLANNQVLGGINKVKQMFTGNKIKIFPHCENLISELKTYRWKEKKAKDQDELEQPMKVKDHACDALRYMAATYFTSPHLPPKPIVVHSEAYFKGIKTMPVKESRGV